MTEEEEKTYRIKYKMDFRFGDFRSEDALQAGKDWGVADGILHGIFVRHQGTLNAQFSMIDGDGSHNELILAQMWAMLTNQIAQGSSLFSKVAAKYADEIKEKLQIPEELPNNASLQ